MTINNNTTDNTHHNSSCKSSHALSSYGSTLKVQLTFRQQQRFHYHGIPIDPPQRTAVNMPAIMQLFRVILATQFTYYQPTYTYHPTRPYKNENLEVKLTEKLDLLPFRHIDSYPISLISFLIIIHPSIHPPAFFTPPPFYLLLPTASPLIT